MTKRTAVLLRTVMIGPGCVPLKESEEVANNTMILRGYTVTLRVLSPGDTCAIVGGRKTPWTPVRFNEYEPGSNGEKMYFSEIFWLGMVPANISPEVSLVPLGKTRWTINSVEFEVLVVVAVFAVITRAVGLPLSGEDTEATKAVAPMIIERTRALAIIEASRCIGIS